MFWRSKKTLSPVSEEKTIAEKKKEEDLQKFIEASSRREKLKRIEYTREEASCTALYFLRYQGARRARRLNRIRLR